MYFGICEEVLKSDLDFLFNRATSEPLANTVPYLEASNVLFMGSNIVEGSGQGVVVATGVDNQVSVLSVELVCRCKDTHMSDVY